MRLCSSKADLKSKTQVPISGRYVDSLDCLVLDGCAILWVVQWPSNSSHQQAQVKDFVDSFESYILHRLQDKEVYLVFDRYLEYSTKSCTRQARGAGGCKTFQRTYSSPLPTQTQVLNNPKNKKQLIAIIVQKLKQSLTEQISQHKLVITGQEDCPIELSMGLCIERQDLISHHEEADVIVVSQAIYVSSVEKKSVGVVADDTDIFILLLYHFKLTQPSSAVMMIPTKHGQGRIVADIGKTAEDLGNLCLELLPAHALTGCDQVPKHYGIAKKKMLKAAKENQNSLSLLGKLEENFDDVMNQATRFIASCYSVQGVSNMTEARLKVWNRKAMKKTANKAPPLCSLPPTTAAFKENVKRAHL